jgi:aminoglycoside/choline kinase family phosphotransferase
MSDIFPWIDTVHPAARGGEWSPVERGGSDRQFWRGGGAASGLVAVAYGLEKAENARYADCALFLEAQGVSVPRVIAHDAAQRFLLLEDAGAEDLWSHREAPWEKRAQLYRETLEQAALLHGADLAAAERELPALIRRYPLFADARAGLTAGVVTELGPPGAAVVALRLDMDALSIEERTGLSWASK